MECGDVNILSRQQQVCKLELVYKQQALGNKALAHRQQAWDMQRA